MEDFIFNFVSHPRWFLTGPFIILEKDTVIFAIFPGVFTFSTKYISKDYGIHFGLLERAFGIAVTQILVVDRELTIGNERKSFW